MAGLAKWWRSVGPARKPANKSEAGRAETVFTTLGAKATSDRIVPIGQTSKQKYCPDN
jgi:hypothetical protein